MALEEFEKDPNAILDYGCDWTLWLAGDTITASTWAITPTGGTLTTSLPTFAPTGTTTVWLTGGAVGERYTVTNHITTTAGRQNDRSFTLDIVEQ